MVVGVLINPAGQLMAAYGGGAATAKRDTPADAAVQTFRFGWKVGGIGRGVCVCVCGI